MRQAENAAIKAYEKNLIQNVLGSIEKHGGMKYLLSIVLTGSFGRGESTYEVDGEGNFQLKSDVEIALIYLNSLKKGAIEKLIKDVSNEFTEDLNLMGINEKRVRMAYNYNFSLKTPKYKTIFTYDFYNGSKTIWGEKLIEAKNICLEEVDTYEAKRLVANRIGELIYLQMHTVDSEKRTELRKQWKGKLILAIASAWLICEGSYEPSYHGQYNQMKLKTDQVADQIGEGFMVDYEKVFLFLRENKNPYEVPNDTLRVYIQKMDSYFIAQHIKTPKVNSVSRLTKYFIKYLIAGMKYGISGYEERILQALITDFGKEDQTVEKNAELWYRVLY